MSKLRQKYNLLAESSACEVPIVRPTPPTRGKGPTRGRSCQRGGRVLKGRVYDRAEKKMLLHYRDEREKRADDLVEEMMDKERKSFLKELVAKQPSLVLDVAVNTSKSANVYKNMSIFV